jgi:hypothetical protein
MRKVALFAMMGAAVLGPAAASRASGSAPEIRTVAPFVKPAKGLQAVSFGVLLGTSRPDGLLPNLAVRDRITLPLGFQYNGGIRKSPTGKATAFSTCTGPDGNGNGIPDRFEGGPGGPCPSASRVGSGTATTLQHFCNDKQTPMGAFSRRTFDIVVFNGGGRLAGNGGTLYALVFDRFSSVGGVMKVSFTSNVISFDVPDTVISLGGTAGGASGDCEPLVSMFLHLGRSSDFSLPPVLTANTTVLRRVRGRVRSVTVKRGLIEAGPCPSSRQWNVFDDVDFSTGARDPSGPIIRDPGRGAVTSTQGYSRVITCV